MATPDEIETQQALLTTYRATLAHYLQQQAMFSLPFTPPHVLHGIHDSRDHIQRIIATLRAWGVAVEALPDDYDTLSPVIPTGIFGPLGQRTFYSGPKNLHSQCARVR